MSRRHTILLGLIILGLGLRSYHYFRMPDVWHDEAALLINAMDKSYTEHYGPLFYAEAAPPFFLHVERFLGEWSNENLLVLRSFPFLVSCATFLALCWISLRYLPPLAGCALALLAAVSDRMLWHCCEAKPYAVDAAIAMCVLCLFLLFVRPKAWTEQSDIDPKRMARFLWTMALLTPLFIWMSFPACFVLGGAVLAATYFTIRQKSYALFAPITVFTLFLGISFLLLLTGPIHAQSQEALLNDWTTLLPDFENYWSIPGRFLLRAVEVGRYAAEPIGHVLLIFALVAVIQLWRNGQQVLVLLLVGPFALLWCAWFMGKYPMGPSRVVLFLTPALLILIALGMQYVWDQTRQRRPLVTAALVLLLSIPVGQTVFRAIAPWPRAGTGDALAYLRKESMPTDTVIGTAWEHTWYLRRSEFDLRTLLALPHAPATPPAWTNQWDNLQERCWVLVRTTRRSEEKQALENLLRATSHKIVETRDYPLLRLYRLETMEAISMKSLD